MTQLPIIRSVALRKPEAERVKYAGRMVEGVSDGTEPQDARVSSSATQSWIRYTRTLYPGYTPGAPRLTAPRRPLTHAT